MSMNESMFDQILKNDENVKRWKNQIIDEENFITTLENDLETERAKENLLLSEMKGKIMQIEQLALRSRERASEKLQNLMVDQLVEVNKSEILVKVNEENYRRCAISLKEMSKWKPTDPQILVTGSLRAQEKDQDDEFPTLGNLQNERKDVLEELKLDDREIMQKDILNIEEVITECEKEHAVLKEFLKGYQNNLMEIESRATDGIETTLDESIKEVDEPVYSVTNKPLSKMRADLRVDVDPAPSRIISAPSLSVTRPKIQSTTFQAKTAILSKKARELQCPIEYSTSGTSKENPPPKKIKLNLYDTSVLAQPSAAPNQNLHTSESKSITSFKFKTPSSLRNRIN